MLSQIAKAGTTNRKRKRIQAARNSEKGRTGVRHVSGCPFCPVGPDNIPVAATVGWGQRTASCQKGHRWPIIKPLV